jgi:Transposase
MPKTRLAYPEQFRRETVQLVRDGRLIADVAASLGVPQQSLRNWVRRDEANRGEREDALSTAEREELRRLRRAAGAETCSAIPKSSRSGASGDGLALARRPGQRRSNAARPAARIALRASDCPRRNDAVVVGGWSE